MSVSETNIASLTGLVKTQVEPISKRHLPLYYLKYTQIFKISLAPEAHPSNTYVMEFGNGGKDQLVYFYW